MVEKVDRVRSQEKRKKYERYVFDKIGFEQWTITCMKHPTKKNRSHVYSRLMLYIAPSSLF